MTNRLATNPAQQVIWRWEGEAFGNTPAQELASIQVNLRFPGQYYDAETNLHYNWNRYYDPELGRYITSDPIGLRGGMNAYGYAGASPIVSYDLDGLKIVCWPWGCKGDQNLPPTDKTEPSKLPKSPAGSNCTNKPTMHGCLSCCSTVAGQVGNGTGMGSSCAEQCYRKHGITDSGDAGEKQCKTTDDGNNGNPIF